MKIASFDAFSFSDQTIYIGYYRDTGWTMNHVPLKTPEITVGLTTVRLYSQDAPATGTTAVPDEQTHTPPRALNWKETKLSFTSGGVTIAEFFWKHIASWSTTAPQSV